MLFKNLTKYTILSLVLLLSASCAPNDSSIGSSSSEKLRTVPSQSTVETASQINTCSKMIPGSPLGISCLHCAHPKAQVQAIQIAEILRDSCRENIAMTMLVDGTFGTNRDFMGELVRIASEYGARLHLYLYLANGPWQRRTSGLPQRGFGTGIKPENFRKRIVTDEALRNTYRNIIKFNEPLVSYATSIGNVAYILPMLEDNLDFQAARAMENLVTTTLLPSLSYAVGRNPCPGCYTGNDASIPPGIFIDQHTGSSINPIFKDGLITNDGVDMNFNEVTNSETEISLSQIKNLIAQSKATNNTFVIWNREYQGVSPDLGLNDPDLRDYHEVSLDERGKLLEILKTP